MCRGLFDDFINIYDWIWKFEREIERQSVCERGGGRREIERVRREGGRGAADRQTERERY